MQPVLWRSIIGGLIVVLLLVSACNPHSSGNAPTIELTAAPLPTESIPSTTMPTQVPHSPTPAHIAVPTPGATWNYVVIGDSSSFGFPPFYAKHIEADLGVKVNLIPWTVGFMTSSQILTQLRDSKFMRLQVSQAEVITFRGGPWDQIGDRIYSGKVSDRYDCSPRAVASFKADFDSSIEEIFALRKGQPTIIRTYNLYSPWHRNWKAWGVYDEYCRCVAALNAAIRQSAQEHGILMADVYMVFNGPNGDEDPNDKGILGDGVHPNDLGTRIIADLFRKLGYAPVVP